MQDVSKQKMIGSKEMSKNHQQPRLPDLKKNWFWCHFLQVAFNLFSDDVSQSQ